MHKRELSGLTGIRFYAALLVYLYHVVLTIPGMDVVGGRTLFFSAAEVGVSFFFLLSGFILTYNYADVFRGGISVAGYKRFVWDRLTKIYPVHFLTLLLVLPIPTFSPHLPLDWRAVPLHLLLLQCFWPSSSRGSPESARAQPARRGQLFPLFDSCPASPRRERSLPSLGMGRALVARLRGGRDRAVHGRPDRRLADLLRIRDPMATAFEEFPRPAA